MLRRVRSAIFSPSTTGVGVEWHLLKLFGRCSAANPTHFVGAGLPAIRDAAPRELPSLAIAECGSELARQFHCSRASSLPRPTVSIPLEGKVLLEDESATVIEFSTEMGLSKCPSHLTRLYLLTTSGLKSSSARIFSAIALASSRLR